MRRYKVTIVVMAALLVLPVTSWAACAWVLWYFEAPFGWSSLLATVTKLECDQKAHEMFAQVRVASALLTAPERPLLSYQCFPDTVDPRGQKGK